MRLALGYPAASVNVQLTLDDHGRIGEETLTDAKHLLAPRRGVEPAERLVSTGGGRGDVPGRG